MDKRLDISLRKLTWLLCCMVVIVSCSGTPEETKSIDMDDSDVANGMDSTDGGGNVIDSTEVDAPTGSYSPVLFSVIGDVPYDEAELAELGNVIQNHNQEADSEFVIHLGDIKPGSAPCGKEVYEEVSALLESFETPVFIVLGDNEYNDCEVPEEALGLWNSYFLHFNENWEFPHPIEYQQERAENFTWVQNGVRFVGLNLVGSSVHDRAEWDGRMEDNAAWAETLLSNDGDSVDAAVFFWHANVTEVGPEKFKAFTDRFRAAAKTFGKPVLYLQGDGHLWFKNRPWPERNILRVQVDAGTEVLQVSVDANLAEPFTFERGFLDK